MEVQALPSTEIPILATGNDASAESVAPEDIHKTFQLKYLDLISGALNSKIVATSDEWFAAASNLITPTAPVRKPGVFTHAGAWYDGWETRRHNTKPFDWVIIRLGVASGQIAGVEVDTAFFNGNNAPEIAVQAGSCENDADADNKVLAWGPGEHEEEGGWETVLDKQECGPSQRFAWKIPGGLTKKAYTHVRLCMYPDGGIARFRLFGRAVPVFPADENAVLDLAAAQNGGLAVACSDQHFGVISNLLLPGRGKDMGDGWETKRSRGKDHVDWVIVKLGAEGSLEKVVVDTAHFRGNFPRSVRVEGITWKDQAEPTGDSKGWTPVLGVSKCGPDQEHHFDQEQLRASGVSEEQTFTHVKLVIIPDGGVKRFRVWGRRRKA
ncbi:MAG: Allantoicase [Chaenotheca gracillima]|nr:MAG: Allantoicase [Chaenotheca gracillima]